MQLHSRPRHPGRVLLYEFLEPMACSREELARELGWTQADLNTFMAGDRCVDPDMAEDLARVLGTSRYLWLQLQAAYSSWLAAQRCGNIPTQEYKFAA